MFAILFERLKMYCKQNVLSLGKQICYSFIVQRVVAAGIVFITSLLLAKILGIEKFGQIAFYMYLIKFFVSGQLGSESGFFYHYYSNTGGLNSSHYVTIYSIQLWLVASLVCISSFYLGSIYFYAAVGFALLVPFFSIGPILRINRVFSATLLPDIIISISTFSGVCIWKSLSLKTTVANRDMLVLSMIVLIFSYPIAFLLYKKLNIRISLSILKDPVIIKKYLKLIRDGIPLFLATLAYTILLMVDRFFLEKFASHKSLSVYMLAFQLVVGASLPLSSQNFISVIDIGETSRDSRSMHKVLQHQLYLSARIGVVTYIGLIAIAFALDKWYLVGYNGLVPLCATLGIGLVLFFISGSVTPIAFYNGKQGLLTKSLFLVVALCVVHNLIIVYLKWPPLWVGHFTAAWLGLYSVFAILLSRNIIRRKVA